MNEVFPLEESINQLSRPERGVGRYVRQPFSSLSHLFGMLLAFVALIQLVSVSGDSWRAIVSSCVYGISLVLLFLASSLLHGVHCTDKTERFFERCDHAMIFLLIAGTYTPVCLLIIPGATGMALLAVEWALALAGIYCTVADVPIPRWLSVSIYLVMGWLFVFALDPLISAVSNDALTWLLAGGLFYTVGVIFFATGRPSLWPGYFEAHDLWHVFVLGGSACHFVFINNSVLQFMQSFMNSLPH